MLLRVYTMWNRSRTILYVLLFVYALQVIDSVVLPAIYNSSNTYFTRTSQLKLKVSMQSLANPYNPYL